MRFYCDHDAEAIQFLTVPASIPHMPGQDRLVADEIHLAVGKALRDINISAAALDVVALDLLRPGSDSKRQKKKQRDSAHKPLQIALFSLARTGRPMLLGS